MIHGPNAEPFYGSRAWALRLHQERIAVDVRRFTRLQAARPTCDFPGCQTKADWPAMSHEGMHPSDLETKVYCAYHEDELWLISNIQDDVERELGKGFYSLIGDASCGCGSADPFGHDINCLGVNQG